MLSPILTEPPKATREFAPARAESAGDKIVSTIELSAWLGITGHAIADLANRGVISWSSRGRWPLRATNFAVLDHYRQIAAGRSGEAEGALGAARARLAVAKAEEAERQNALARAEFAPVDDMVEFISGANRMVVQRILAIPAEHAPALVACSTPAELAGKLTKLLREALDELSSEFAVRCRAEAHARTVARK